MGSPDRGRSRVGPRAPAGWIRTGGLGLLHALVASAAVAGFAWWLAGDRRSGMAGDLLVHASGLAALLWAYLGLLTGLLAGTRPLGRGASAGGGPKRTVPPVPPAVTPERRRSRSLRPALVTLHRQLNLAVIALTLLHALYFALGTPGGTLAGALVPGVEPVRGLAFGLGIIGLYLMVLLGPSYYLRRWIGRRTWLVAHQLAAISYAVSLWHALVTGPHLTMPGPARVVVGILQFPLLALMAIRLTRPLRAADDLRVLHRRGRFTGWRHSTLRNAVAWGLAVAGSLVLTLALLSVQAQPPR